MWTARIVLIGTALLTVGGWFDAPLPRVKKRLLLLALLIVTALSFVPMVRLR